RGSSSGKVVQTTFELPPVKPDEVLVKVTHSGLCGSDIHMLSQPLVLGHEGKSTSMRIGIVEEVGSACSLFNVGDRVGWGLLNSTCGHCAFCLTGKDAYCPEGRNYGTVDFDTQGSLCSHAVRKEQWIFHVPDSMTSEDAGPLMCGGGTVWVPLIGHCKPYERVGIVAIGGLGHLAIQFAAKMGCDVVVFSSTEDKREEAMNLGASEFYPTRGVSDYATLGVTKPIDRLLITSSVKFNLGIFYPILAKNAKIFPLSVDSGDLTAPYFLTVFCGHEIIGSCICSRYLQDKMLDFAARNGIHAIVEKFPMTREGIQAAVDKLGSRKMRYRGVIGWDY
ncbi:NADP-dependent alcohol dehydrogenase, partial [Lineolata rhizophorae]